MSTNGMTSWAVDLKDIAAIYPFEGSEFLMYMLGLAFWIIWHVIQIRGEATEVHHEMEADKTGDEARAAIERY